MKKSISQLKPYVPEEPLDKLKKRLQLKRVVRLSANENPYGTSPRIATMLQTTAFESNRYPDGAAAQLRDAVSDFYDVNPAQLVFGCGLDEIISLLNRTFLTDGDEVLVNVPTFSEYMINAEIEEAVPVEVPTKDDGQIDFAALLAAITDKTKMIWLCNPNNPTGTYETKADIKRFVREVPADVLVIVDEAYLEYVTDEANPSVLDLPGQQDNVIVLKTFSKVYGLANFRVGFGIFPLRLASYIQSVRPPYNLNSISQTAALTGLRDQDFVTATVAKTVAEREKWEAFFRQNGIQFYHSQTNFLFFTVPEADRVSDFLLQNGFLIRNGLRQGWLRLTIGEPADNLRIQQLLLQCLN